MSVFICLSVSPFAFSRKLDDKMLTLEFDQLHEFLKNVINLQRTRPVTTSVWIQLAMKC